MKIDRRLHADLVVILLGILLVVCSARAAWERVQGPYGGTVKSCAIWNGKLAVYAVNNVYARDPSGRWTRLATVTPPVAGITASPSVQYIFAMGQVLFAVCDTMLLSYEPLTDSWSRRGVVNGGFIAPFESILLMMAPSNRLVVSADSGRTWIARGPTFSCGGTLFSANGLLYFSSGGGTIYTSADTGHTWRTGNGTVITGSSGVGFAGSADVGCDYFQALVVRGSELLTCDPSGWIRYSADTGRTWSNRGLAGYCGSSPNPWEFVALGNTLVVAGRQGIYRSTDDGRHFIQVLSANYFSRLLVVDSLLYLVRDDLQCSRDSGLTWTPVSSEGMEEMPCDWLQSDGSNLYARLGGHLLFRSSDSTSLWQAVRNFPSTDIGVWPDKMFSFTNDGLYISFDKGSSWGFSGHVAFIPTFAGQYCYAWMIPWTSGLVRSSNDGLSWSVLPPCPGEPPLYGVAGSLYTFGYMGPDFALWTSQDLGLTWSRLPLTTFGGYGTWLVGLGRALYVFDWNRSFLSLDRGQRWSVADSLPGSRSRFTAVASDSLRLVAASARNGRLDVRYTGGVGYSWISISEGLPLGATVSALCLSGRFLYAGTTSEGIWRRPSFDLIPVLGIGAPAALGPAHFDLKQNYPNPFNPSTSIQFALPRRSHVVLTVFNTLGQKVAELVNGDIDPGYHEVRFDAGNLASGAYFYRLQAGTSTKIRSMCVVK